jgi:hypothetical protein
MSGTLVTVGDLGGAVRHLDQGEQPHVGLAVGGLDGVA